MQDAVAIAKVVLDGSERNTTWSPVNPFFFSLARAPSKVITWFPLGPTLIQFAWALGAPGVLSGKGDSKFPT